MCLVNTGSGGQLVDLCKLGSDRDAFGKPGQQLLRRVKGLSKTRRKVVKVGQGSAATCLNVSTLHSGKKKKID